MGLNALFFLAIVSAAFAAPWRCVKTQDGCTICFADCGQPTISPPAISVGRQPPPCACSATVYTPPSCHQPQPPTPEPRQLLLTPCGQRRPCYI